MVLKCTYSLCFRDTRNIISCVVLIFLTVTLAGLTSSAPIGNESEESDEEILFTDKIFDIIFDESSEEEDYYGDGVAMRAAPIRKRPGYTGPYIKPVDGPPQMFYPHPPRGRSLILTIKVPECNDACKQMARRMSVGAKLKTKRQ